LISVNHICTVNKISLQIKREIQTVYKVYLQLQTFNIQSNMTERKKFFNNPLSCRFSPDEYNLREEQFSEMFPDLEPEGITTRVVLNSLFDRAFGIFKKSNEPRKQDLEAIEQLNKEIGSLKIEIDLKNEEIARINSCLSDERKSVAELEIALNQQPAGTIIGPDQLLITIPPIIRRVLEIEAVTAKKKTGKEFTIADVLTQSFWESITVGRAYPFRTWSSSEIAKIANELKNEQ